MCHGAPQFAADATLWCVSSASATRPVVSMLEAPSGHTSLGGVVCEFDVFLGVQHESDHGVPRLASVAGSTTPSSGRRGLCQAGGDDEFRAPWTFAMFWGIARRGQAVVTCAAHALRSQVHGIAGGSHAVLAATQRADVRCVWQEGAVPPQMAATLPLARHSVA